MKKLLVIILALMIVLTSFAACKKEEPKDKDEGKAPVVSTDTDNNSKEESKEESKEDSKAPVADEENSVESEDSSIAQAPNSEPDSSVPVGDVEYNEALIGLWSAQEDGAIVVFDIKADGKGSMNMDGLSADIDWYVSNDKLTINMSVYGITEPMVENADYTVDGDSLSITYEGETIVLTKGEIVPEDSSTEDSVIAIPAEKEYDTILLGTWGYLEDGVAMLITFEKDGKGKVKMDGISLNLDWYTVDEKLTAVMSLLGESEVLFEDNEYTVDVDKLFVTIEDETIMLAKDNTDKNNNTNTEESTETSTVVNTEREYDNALLGTWTAEEEGVTFTFTFEEEGVGFVNVVDSNEEMSFYIDWYTNNGILETTITEMDGVEINEPLASFEYEINGESLSLTEDGDTLVFTAK